MVGADFIFPNLIYFLARRGGLHSGMTGFTPTSEFCVDCAEAGDNLGLAVHDFNPQATELRIFSSCQPSLAHWKIIELDEKSKLHLGKSFSLVLRQAFLTSEIQAGLNLSTLQ